MKPQQMIPNKIPFSFLICLTLLLSTVSCDTVQQVVTSQLGVTSSEQPLTNDDIIAGLKEALIQGTTKGVDVLSIKDGFFKEPSVKILFPPEAQKIEKTLRDIGLNNLVDNAIEKLNRAAEDASSSAKDIFIQSIKQMTVNDAMGILMGESNACTQYLKNTTTQSLFDAFNPVISTSLNKVGASDIWNSVMSSYNKVPFVEKIDPDLDRYVTNKAIDGVFLMIEKEEKLIRKDPVARVTDLLKKVFAKQD